MLPSTALSSPVQEQSTIGHLTCKSWISLLHPASGNTCQLEIENKRTQDNDSLRDKADRSIGTATILLHEMISNVLGRSSWQQWLNRSDYPSHDYWNFKSGYYAIHEDFQEEKKTRGYGVNSIQSKLQKAQTGKNTSGQRAYWPGHVLWVFCLLDTLNQDACKQQHDKLKNWNV